VAVFLDKTRAHEFGYAWELLFATLARIGELAALRWDDLVDGRLIIRRTWGKSPDGRMQIADQTKTHLQRAVPLPASTLAMLERVRNGRAADSEWIIEIKGAPVSPHKLRHAWNQAIAGMKLPELSPHGARHSGATNMIAAGVPVRSVQRILGHTSVHMTLERYVHPTDSDTAAAVEALDTLYRGAKAKNIVKNVSDENPPHENDREDAGI
jgi:integrase